MSKALLLALLSAMPAHASQCAGANSWLNPATGETGACIAPTGGTYAYHCPWESLGSVSAYGCGKISYDCANHVMLTAYYNSGPAKEWGDAAKAYGVKCIAKQCAGGTDPGPGCAPHGRGQGDDTCATMFPQARRLVSV